MRRTKIIGTLGPASNSKRVIKKLLFAGLDIVRLNMSHWTQPECKKIIALVRSVEKELNIPVAILLDLQGPKIRTGIVRNSYITLHAGKEITITTKDILGSEFKISTSYKNLPKDVKKGDRILLNDGLIELKVKKVKKSEILCSVVNGGILKNHKGINLPG
ncbi:pyruvate kinase, partial [Candidatus Margulisiibacteriota bacterium]